MYTQGSLVLKKGIFDGITIGTVQRSWLSPSTGEEYVRVLWKETKRQSTSKASAILPNTPASIASLEKRLEARESKRQALINEPAPVKMCPFCRLLVEDSLCDPIGTGFFGQPAKIGDIASCDGCAQVAAMSENGVQDMLAMLKDSQSKEGVTL